MNCLTLINIGHVHTATDSEIGCPATAELSIALAVAKAVVSTADSMEILPNFLNLVDGTLFTKLTRLDKVDMAINYQFFLMNRSFLFKKARNLIALRMMSANSNK